MKLLPDECVTRFPKRDLIGHEVSTVDEAGFKGLKNGTLLRAAQDTFDVLVTVDKSIRHQQNLQSFQIAVLLLTAQSNRYQTSSLLSLWRSTLSSLCNPASFVQVGPPLEKS